MTDKLKPCPFCGKEPSSYRLRGRKWYVACTETHGIQIGHYARIFERTEEEAIAAWNRRTPDARLEAERAVIEAARYLCPPGHPGYSTWGHGARKLADAITDLDRARDLAKAGKSKDKLSGGYETVNQEDRH